MPLSAFASVQRLLGVPQGLVDFALGFDFFISYAHADGPSYPAALTVALERVGFRVCLDARTYVPGDDLRFATQRRIKMSKYLLIVAGPHALTSLWVSREIDVALGFGRRVIVVDVNGAFAGAPSDVPLRRRLLDHIYLTESVSEDSPVPSTAVIAELQRSFAASRKQSRKVSRRSERGWKSVWRPQTLRTTLVLGALMFAYQSMSFWYATLLRLDGRVPLPYVVALNVGGILGAVLWGALADTRIRRRGTISLASAASVVALPLFLYSSSSLGYWSGALLIGATAGGVIGIAPAYVASQFPTDFRGAGSGLAYHTAAAIGAIAPYGLGALQDASWSLRGAMAMSIAVAAGSAVALVWTGPERQED
jgi:hypothetical protein